MAEVPRARESALVVLVPEAEPLVRAYRERLDPSARVGVPAHITILYPFRDPDRISDGDLALVAATVRRHPPVRYRLARTQRFGDQVLFLAPDPGDPFLELTRAIVGAFPEHLPYGGAYGEPVPHLTVADRAPLDEMEAVARAIEPSLPVVASADEVWLLVEGSDGRWAERTAFPLEGG